MKPSAQTKPVPTPVNDDIGEATRLALYRSQVRLREAEQRAFDLFLQNLVKGTSHLSLGQEAIAAGFAEFQPIDPGDSEEAYRRNRRIELKLTDR